jgi:hypothetical protein
MHARTHTHTHTDTRCIKLEFFGSYRHSEPITVAAPSKALDAFTRSNTGIMGLNPT